MIQRPLGRVLIGIAVLVSAGAIILPIGGGGAPVAGNANLAVATTGCTASPVRVASTPYASLPSSAKACTFDQANDAANAGDRICVLPGTYNGQSVTGDHSPGVTFTGNCGGAVTVQSVSITDPCPGGVDNQGAAICTTAANAIFEYFTVDALNAHGYSTTMQVRADGSEIRYLNFTASGSGSTSFWDLGQSAYVHNNVFDQDDSTPYQRSCNIGDGQPIQFEDNTGVVFENNMIWQQGSDQTPCSGSANGFHLDVTRWQGSSAPTIRNNYFAEAEAGTGYLFFSGSNSGNGAIIVGNYFTKNSDGSNFMQISGTVGATCTMTFAYNTFFDGYATQGCSESSNVWVGNAGFYQGCTGAVHTANVWATSGSCAGNTFVSGATIASALGINAATGRPTSAGSAAVNAAETAPGTYCNGATFANSIDFDGHVRPFLGNAKCTAGAFEWAG